MEIVRRINDAYVAGDYETALALISPEVEVRIVTQGQQGYRGHEGVAEALRTWTGTWEAYRNELEEIIDAGEHVITVDRQSGRGKGSGLPLTEKFFGVYTIRDDKVVRIEWFTTREQALEAAGLSE